MGVRRALLPQTALAFGLGLLICDLYEVITNISTYAQRNVSQRDTIFVTPHKAVGCSVGKWNALVWPLAAQV